MLLRVRDYGTAHRELFPESSSGREAFDTVAHAIEQIDAHATAALSAARESQKTTTARRRVILERMQSIARTSRGVRTTAGTRLKLPMPTHTSDVAVITAARSFLNQAEPLHDQFVALGLSPTCLTELREAADAFDAAMADRRAGRAGVAAIQAGIKAALAQGCDAARTLDIAVVNTVGQDPVLLAAWQRDRRVVEGIGRGGSSQHPAPAPAADAAADGAPAASLRKAS
jgi:hypothetical protein